MDAEDGVCKLELSSTKLFKFRRHFVTFKVKRSWRLDHNLTEPDIFNALLTARCCLLGSDTEAACKKCKCSPVVVLSATEQHPTYDASTDIETYECAIQSRCTSSRDHLKSSLVLVINKIPSKPDIASNPFVLHARDKSKPDKKEADDQKQQQQQQQPMLLFKRGRSESPTEPGIPIKTEEQLPIIEQQQQQPQTSLPDENSSTIPDCSAMLPEAFVSSYLLEKRNKHQQIEEDSKQPPEQRRHVSEPEPMENPPLASPQPSQQQPESFSAAATLAPIGDVETGTATMPQQTSPSASIESHDEMPQSSLFSGSDYSDLPSYFDGPFSSYPKGDNAFSGFVLLSPTLMDLPPYSLNDE